MGLLKGTSSLAASKARPILHFLVVLSLTKIPYPEVRRDTTVVDDYFGTKIPDPYRWLEDIDSVETQKFVEQQQNLTSQFLESVPVRNLIRERLKNVWNYPKFSSPEKIGKRYFNFENTGLQNQSIMYWSRDKKGIFYARFPKSDLKSTVTENSKIFYHKLGTPQDDDILIAEFPQYPKRILSLEVTECGGYLIITGSEVFDANTVHIISLDKGIDETLKSKIVPVFPSATEATYTFISNEGPTFLFQTSKDAPNHKLITVNIDLTPGHNSDGKEEIGRVTLFSTFLAENPKNVLNWASVIGSDKIVICYLADVKHVLELRSLKDASLLHKFDLQPGSISGFTSDGKDDTEFFFALQSFLSPGTIYRCEVDVSVKCEVHRQIEVSNTDLSAFITEQIFYPSKDGTLIPMYIVRKKDVPLDDGSAPTLLYGYGGFNSKMLPRFSVSNLVFVNNFNGIYVLANIRGGGEYGEKWHQAGSLLNKQNVFDDFQGAAEYLIKYNYTSASKITIQGGSNGGLLIGACVNQRPDLFGAAIAQVGVMDMLRYQHFTIGYAWCAEYGSARQTNPLLLRVDIKAGHGAGKPTSKKIEEVADMYSFMAETLGLEFKVYISIPGSSV
ncbi:unnamed protein product [Allacma fusca]|uniref:Prolyl endopeptidase n=1 Tax=Allacma fusca TaxID=39272 RepID=A0A8J2Q056_9HEXA|nr:unnamed protein product [Allacma fusca]